MSKPKSRQAVLLIHGIGEQRPMSTLRSFVAALVGNGFRSKPDDLSKSFELRRLTYDVEEEKIYQTCFFECYWAYRLRDTNYRNILEWGCRLLRASWKDIPPRLRLIWLMCWIMVVFALLAVVVLVVYLANKTGTPTTWVEEVSRWASWIGMGLTLILGLISGYLLYWIGDAARYLDSVPANILERQAIRAEGVDLLRRLHDAKDGNKPKYDRIIIIGHSLGSVIGYDILKFYWAEVNEQLLIASGSNAASKLKELDQCNTPESYQKAQDVLIKALPSDKPWRITDFITLGSPLTYADFLIATSADDLNLLKKQRELPTCPPQKDEETHRYSFEDKDDKDKVVGEKLHHAAHFAVTKWTNFYFPEDLIGGKVGPLFGQGVVDIKCDFPPDRNPFGWLLRWLRSHTQYWPNDRDPPPTSLNHLKAIMSWPDRRN
jgi:hypothetical protein